MNLILLLLAAIPSGSLIYILVLAVFIEWKDRKDRE